MNTNYITIKKSDTYWGGGGLVMDIVHVQTTSLDQFRDVVFITQA